MKHIWTIIALTGFVFVSVFGLSLMPYNGPHHDLVKCLASLVNSSESPCPQADPIGFASFHNNALKKISSLILVENTAMFYAMILSVILFLSLMFTLPASGYSSGRAWHSGSLLPVVSHQLLAVRKWFSLHENSPSSI